MKKNKQGIPTEKFGYRDKENERLAFDIRMAQLSAEIARRNADILILESEIKNLEFQKKILDEELNPPKVIA